MVRAERNATAGLGARRRPDVPARASSPGVRPVHQPAAGWGQAHCARRRPGPGPRREAGPGARRRARAPYRAARGNVTGRVANRRPAPPPHSETHAADPGRGLRGHSTPVAPLSGPQLRRATVERHQTALPTSPPIRQLRCVVAAFVGPIMEAESPGSAHRPALLRLRDSRSGRPGPSRRGPAAPFRGPVTRTVLDGRMSVREQHTGVRSRVDGLWERSHSMSPLRSARGGTL